MLAPVASWLVIGYCLQRMALQENNRNILLQQRETRRAGASSGGCFRVGEAVAVVLAGARLQALKVLFNQEVERDSSGIFRGSQGDLVGLGPTLSLISRNDDADGVIVE